MVYESKTIKAPILRGGALKAYASAVRTPVLGGLLGSQMLGLAGVPQLREFVADDKLCSLRKRFFRPNQWGPYERTVSESLKSWPDQSPTTDDFQFWTVKDYADAYASGKKSPVDVANAFLAAVDDSESCQPPMRFFVAQDKADLMKQAEASAERWKAGKPLSLLDGVPVAVKDEVDMVPYPTTVGTAFMGKSPATEDAVTVARLRETGALLLGKSNMHELGMGVTGVNPHHGAARNPYDSRRVTGGSSSGPAACVGAGLCPVALGADGGGSIRLPAAFCGVVGIKPTFGRVPEGGAAPLCWTVAHIGPIAATALDCWAGYVAMAGPDVGEESTLLQPPENTQWPTADGLAGKKIGIFRQWTSDTDADVQAIFQKALAQLAQSGAELVDVTIPNLHLSRVAHLTSIISEMGASQLKHVAEHLKEYGVDIQLNLKLIEGLTASDYVQAQRVRDQTIAQMESLFEAVDFIVTPATGCLPPIIHPNAESAGESDLGTLDRIMRFAPLANLTGHPAITFPAGYAEGNVPVAIQLIGKAWSEMELLSAAHTFENHVQRAKPQKHWDLLA